MLKIGVIGLGNIAQKGVFTRHGGDARPVWISSNDA